MVSGGQCVVCELSMMVSEWSVSGSWVLSWWSVIGQWVVSQVVVCTLCSHALFAHMHMIIKTVSKSD